MDDKLKKKRKKRESNNAKRTFPYVLPDFCVSARLARIRCFPFLSFAVLCCALNFAYEGEIPP